MRKVIFFKYNFNKLGNWIFMRVIWILFYPKKRTQITQFCFMWHPPSIFDKKWICVYLESSNQYVWKDLKVARYGEQINEETKNKDKWKNF